MQHLESEFEGTDGVQLYYQAWRPDTEPRAVVVIVHGIGEHSGRYNNVVEHLVPLGFAVYALDHRGHGRSAGKRGHINAWSEYRADLRAFVERVWQQEPERPFFMLGHSMGGLIVLDYGLHHPDQLQGVIASAPALAQSGVSSLLVLMSKILSRIAPAVIVKTGLSAESISRDPAVVQAYRDDPLVHGYASPRLGTELTATMERTMERANQWRIPLLIVHGSVDALVPAASSQAFFERVPIADKQRIEYEGAYHEVHNGPDQEQEIAALAHWLEAHLPSAGAT